MAVSDVSLRDFQAVSSGTSCLDRICVDGLELEADAGFDGFGRPKGQPVSIDATVFLNETVSSAAAIDQLDRSTLHYGELSKALVQRVGGMRGGWQPPQALLEQLITTVIGFARERSSIARLDVGVRFKQASLASSQGSSLWLYNNYLANATCLVFALEDVVLPALIGVNSHERQMRQQIRVSVWIDRLDAMVANECYQVEQIVAKTVDESSFETLEALSESIAANLVKYFVLARSAKDAAADQGAEAAGVRVRVGKPFAVAAARAATVEIYRSALLDDAFGRRMRAELGSKRPQMPFPLHGRLDEFLRSWKQD